MLKIRPITELMAMSTIGLMTTLYECSTHSMNDNIRDVWATHFRGSSTFGMESITKSVMTAIALARGLTVHIYMAAYALMFYPFLFKRGVSLLLLWMLICAVRSVIVNLVALLTGCIICSCGVDLKPVCFEFSTTKAIEIACSVYMWLSVNDFHIQLRSRRRSILAGRMLTKETGISDSDLSLLSNTDITLESYVDFDEDIEDPSDDSLMVKAAVDWLMKKAFGAKYENRMVETDAARTQRFLNLSAEELKELQNRIKEKLYEDVGIYVGEQPSEDGQRESASDELLDEESSSGSQLMDDIGQKRLNTEPSMMVLKGNHSTAKKNKSEIIKNQSNEDGNRLYKNLATQSTGSQTKEPSKKLQERLSKEEISPKVSNTLEPTPKPTMGRESKTLSASRDVGMGGQARMSKPLSASRDVGMGSQARMSKTPSASRDVGGSQAGMSKTPSASRDSGMGGQARMSKTHSASRDVGMGSQARISKSNSRDDRAPEEPLTISSVPKESESVRGIMRSPGHESRSAVDTDVMAKKNVSLKKKPQ